MRAPACKLIGLSAPRPAYLSHRIDLLVGLPGWRIKMILTQCAVCATDLGLSLGKKCGRCSTRYCGPECQVQHWKEGGHDKICKLIKKAGSAERYYANKKYAEAVSVALTEACAEDTRPDVLHLHAGPAGRQRRGLVRRCSCRGTAGFARVVSSGAGEDFGREARIISGPHAVAAWCV